MADLDQTLIQNPISTPKSGEAPAKASPTDATKKAPDTKSDPAKPDAPKGGTDKVSKGKTLGLPRLLWFANNPSGLSQVPTID
jgi:hypothetical protein